MKTVKKILLIAAIMSMSAMGVFAAEPASLSYFKHDGSSLQWNWFDTDKETSRAVYSFKEGPAVLYVEAGSSTVWVTAGNHITAFTKSRERLPAEQDIALPQLFNDEKPKALWRDAKDKKLRLATWINAYELPVTNDMIHLEDGSHVPVLKDPEWGTNFVTRLFVYDGGIWKIDKVMATKSEAGDTPGLSVLDPYWNEDGYSDIHLTAGQYCAGLSSKFAGRVCHDGPVPESVRDAYYAQFYSSCKRHKDGSLDERDCGATTVGRVACETCRFDLYHPSVEGDRLHAILPVHLYDKQSQTFLPVQIDEQGQVYIQGHETFALIVTKNRVIVIDLQTGRIVLNDEGENALWLP